MIGFWLSRSLPHEIFLFFTSISFFFHDGILAIRKPFTNFFTRWNLGYHGAFSRFFLSHGGISAIMEPLSRIFLSHGGILAITEPFHNFFFHTVKSWLSQSLFTNFSFTRWNFGYHGAFSRTFLSHGGISAITEPFHELFFHTVEFLEKMHDMGEDSFHINHKEYLHRIRLVQNLAS
jgi:hypothetical protein